jgi:hypothetical protein
VPRTTHSSATTTAAGAHTFRRENHLQHLVGVVEEVSILVARCAKNFLRQLRRHLDPRHRRIFRHVADLIDLDAGLSRQRGFQLFGKRRRLCISAGESTHKSRELRLRKVR